MIVNGRFLARPASGVDRFAKELMISVSNELGRPLEVLVPAAVELRNEIGQQHAHISENGHLRGALWEQVELPRIAKGDAVIGLCNSGPLALENQLVVIHDAATFANPGNFSQSFRLWYGFMLSALMRRSRVIASVSNFSASEIQKYLGVRRDVAIIGEGGEHILREPADESIITDLGLEGRRFILAVGNKSPNKNFIAVLNALSILGDQDVMLVAVGGGNDKVFAGASIESNRLIRTGYISDAKLRALYEHAECFVFPSYYEGFGIPPIEAMNCGCPVISSDRSSLPEVCGDAVLYCDPSDPGTIANHLKRVLESETLRQDLKELGYAKAKEHGWVRAGKDFLEIYKANFSKE